LAVPNPDRGRRRARLPPLAAEHRPPLLDHLGVRAVLGHHLLAFLLAGRLGRLGRIDQRQVAHGRPPGVARSRRTALDMTTNGVPAESTAAWKPRRVNDALAAPGPARDATTGSQDGR